MKCLQNDKGLYSCYIIIFCDLRGMKRNELRVDKFCGIKNIHMYKHYLIVVQFLQDIHCIVNRDNMVYVLKVKIRMCYFIRERKVNEDKKMLIETETLRTIKLVKDINRKQIIRKSRFYGAIQKKVKWFMEQKSYRSKHCNRSVVKCHEISRTQK